MKPSLNIILANPRGFCAGVDRAIDIVEKALIKFGPPIYVRHQIVHNQRVVSDLKNKGAVFVKELSEVPLNGKVIFSAHGVAKKVYEEADRNQLDYFDATCPLVTKVHSNLKRYHDLGYNIIVIGHSNHPEIIGTMGQINTPHMYLVENEQDAETVSPNDPQKLAYVTQTTLSLSETETIIKILLRRFPSMIKPTKEDICYATTNRQLAVAEMAKTSDFIIIIGSQNSSNSQRLVEVANNNGCNAVLIDSVNELNQLPLHNYATIGLSAGASAPEIIVQETLNYLNQHFNTTLRELNFTEENIKFKTPNTLL